MTRAAKLKLRRCFVCPGVRFQDEGPETAYRLAFTAPLTAFTAFCVALSQLTHK